MPHMVAADVTRQICVGLDYAHSLARSRRGGAGDRPPGRLAHQHHAGLQRHGEDPRLRDRARGVLRRGGGEEGAHQGEGQLPVARADPRPPVRRARRRVRAGGRFPRDADRAAALPGQERHLPDASAARRADPAPLGAERGHPARARSHRHARAGARSAHALPVGRRHGRGSRAHPDRGPVFEPRAVEAAARPLHAQRRPDRRRRRRGGGQDPRRHRHPDGGAHARVGARSRCAATTTRTRSWGAPCRQRGRGCGAVAGVARSSTFCWRPWRAG